MSKEYGFIEAGPCIQPNMMLPQDLDPDLYDSEGTRPQETILFLVGHIETPVSAEAVSFNTCRDKVHVFSADNTRMQIMYARRILRNSGSDLKIYGLTSLGAYLLTAKSIDEKGFKFKSDIDYRKKVKLEVLPVLEYVHSAKRNKKLSEYELQVPFNPSGTAIMLDLLMDFPKVVAKEKLIESMYSTHKAVEEPEDKFGQLRVEIGSIRKILEKRFGGSFEIETKKPVGYKIVANI